MSDWRYIATRPDGAGGEVVTHWNVPLDDARVTNTLSGPDSIRGTITPEVVGLKAPDGRPVLERWGSCLYAEQNGVIRAGTIVTDLSFRGQTLSLVGTGFAGYPQGMVYTGNVVNYRNTDPAAIATALWAHLQSRPGGNLGVVTKFAPTPVRTGSKTAAEAGQSRDKKTGKYVADDAPRALTVSPEVVPNIGRLIDELAETTPFDYVERHAWSGNKIAHTISSTHPVIGRRRNDLRFVEGENVYNTPDVNEGGSDYISEVYVLGAGAGGKRLRGQQARPGEKRLRRAVVVNDASLRTPQSVKYVAERTVREMTGVPELRDLLLLEHPNAPIGSVSLGDEVLYQMGPSGWKAGLNLWVRVVAITYNPESSESVELTVVPVI